MSFVLDASVAIAWCFEDEKTASNRRALDMILAAGATAPAIWPLEVTNAILVAIRRRRITLPDAVRFLAMLRTLPIEVELASAGAVFMDTFKTAMSQDLSAYDAAYLELALRKGLPLSTLDVRLRRAAAKLGVKLLT